jgi:hypothetical protein
MIRTLVMTSVAALSLLACAPQKSAAPTASPVAAEAAPTVTAPAGDYSWTKTTPACLCA